MLHETAARLDQAEQSRMPLPPLSQEYPTLTPAQAYAIQSAWLDLKLARGARIIGRKIGLTSRAMQELLGVDQPDYGFLLDSMMVTSGGTLSRTDFLLPRIEPEIAFWLAKDLKGPGITVDAVLAATRGVSPALELVDSRIAKWQIKLPDTIADNASSARVIVSEQIVPLDGLDLAAEAVTLTRNGVEVGSGNGAAVLGHPAEAVAWLANKLAEYGIAIEAGQLVLPGAMCAAATVAAGETYRAMFSTIGEVSVRFA
ncbi:MAG: 2-keto-4-pentenoate hydratase [Chloroflexi bacterium]|nr:MAG: 2-keto-4-pentenoate hydratase [Chloroflexota bacterium]